MYIERIRVYEVENKRLKAENDKLRHALVQLEQKMKEMYEKELKDARNVIDETTKAKVQYVKFKNRQRYSMCRAKIVGRSTGSITGSYNMLCAKRGTIHLWQKCVKVCFVREEVEAKYKRFWAKWASIQYVCVKKKQR